MHARAEALESPRREAMRIAGEKVHRDRVIEIRYPYTNEIVATVLIPKSAEQWKTAIYEVRERQALDWPLVSAAVALRPIKDGCEARIVLGHLAPTPWRAPDAEQAARTLGGKAGPSHDPEIAAKAGEAAVSGAKPLSGNKYKVQLARVAVKRAILAAGRA